MGSPARGGGVKGKAKPVVRQKKKKKVERNSKKIKQPGQVWDGESFFCSSVIFQVCVAWENLARLQFQHVQSRRGKSNLCPQPTTTVAGSRRCLLWGKSPSPSDGGTPAGHGPMLQPPQLYL